ASVSYTARHLPIRRARPATFAPPCSLTSPVREGIERGLVDVGPQHALAQVVQDNEGRRTPQPPKRPFVELRPDAGARLPREQADALAAVAEREQEEPRAPVLARRGVADHGDTDRARSPILR